eukprot:1386944-Pleurochrysis_carterae.AAC.1
MDVTAALSLPTRPQLLVRASHRDSLASCHVYSQGYNTTIHTHVATHYCPCYAAHAVQRPSASRRNDRPTDVASGDNQQPTTRKQCRGGRRRTPYI